MLSSAWPLGAGVSVEAHISSYPLTEPIRQWKGRVESILTDLQDVNDHYSS